jgi:hypothetical protein
MGSLFSGLWARRPLFRRKPPYRRLLNVLHYRQQGLK